MSVGWIDRKFYSEFSNNWDDELFRDSILEVISSGHTVLDLGAGAGIVSQMNFRGLVERVYGVDPDKRVSANPHLDVGRVGWAEELPFEDELFDVVFCDNVLEHLDRPEAVFAEVHRVLKPGGVFLAKTPNKFHYVPAFARLTPHRFHQYFNRLRGREESDTFPTRYKANSISDFARLASQTSLELERATLIEGRPEYLRFNVFTYLVGLCYERLVNQFEVFSGLRVLLIGQFRKPVRAGDVVDPGDAIVGDQH